MKRQEEAVINIKSWEEPWNNSRSEQNGSPNKTLKRSLSTLLGTSKSPGILWEMMHSFVPPFLVPQSKGPISLRGPFVTLSAFFLLLMFLGSAKDDSFLVNFFQASFLSFGLWLAFSLVSLGSVRLLRGTLGFTEALYTVGYSVLGYVVVLMMCLMLSYPATSVPHPLFLTTLLLFEGMTASRLVLILIKSMPYPAFQLLIGSVTGSFHIMYLIFLRIRYLP